MAWSDVLFCGDCAIAQFSVTRDNVLISYRRNMEVLYRPDIVASRIFWVSAITTHDCSANSTEWLSQAGRMFGIISLVVLTVHFLYSRSAQRIGTKPLSTICWKEGENSSRCSLGTRMCQGWSVANVPWQLGQLQSHGYRAVRPSMHTFC